jgi:hypothetical protein
MKRLFWFLSVFALTLLACNTPISSGDPISECFPSRTAQVWEDVNENGIFDEGEKPLKGIAVTMYPAGQTSRSFPAQTDDEGVAVLHGIGDFGPKCDELEVVASAPNNYLPTTPTNINLTGLPSSQVLYFGFVSQNPTATVPVFTPTAPASQTATYIDLEKLAAEGEFFEACSLLEPEELSQVFGAPLEFPLTSGGGFGEPGPSTYDCMTDPMEAAVFMYYSLAVEENSSQAADYFNEEVNNLPDDAAPLGGLGEQAHFWTGEEGVSLRLIALQGNVYLNLRLSFWLEDSPENQTRLFDLAQLILDNLIKRGG